ncbi:MAG: ABC transporter permease [Gammaproteobacteria bacterium]|nr:ABC transporter permease [Gammaproteobacteria bacterium]
MLRQVIEITAMNLSNLPSRVGSSSVIVVGIAGVVGVLVALLAMAGGFEAALERGGAPDRAIVLRSGSDSEMASNVGQDAVNIVSSMEEVDASSAELYLVVDVPKRSGGQVANLVIRGVERSGFEIRPEVRIVAGRHFNPGTREMIAGRKASAEFRGIDLGATVELRDGEWAITGLFEANASAYESEMWADLPVAQSAFRRGGATQSMRIRVESPRDIPALAQRVRDDPRLDLEVIGEEEFFRGQSDAMSGLIRGFGYTVALIMAVGAVFAALNAMYTAVSARTVEIATLRALGFGGGPVVVSVIIEALALGVLGGLLGGAVAYFGFNGFTVSTLNQGSFSQVAFDFAVTPDLLLSGLSWAVTLGLFGGLFPAVRAARLPITTALRGE